MVLPSWERRPAPAPSKRRGKKRPLRGRCAGARGQQMPAPPDAGRGLLALGAVARLELFADPRRFSGAPAQI